MSVAISSSKPNVHLDRWRTAQRDAVRSEVLFGSVLKVPAPEIGFP